ncbi:MAG: DUF4276 family protein [Actinomycetota bacterium]|nr:DUF4276 family protein [Actinomycetota bacterium]
MTRTIAAIVEGHGEVSALPVLLRRIAESVVPAEDVEIPRPHRISRSALLKGQKFESAVAAAANKVTDRGGILVLIDADDDCPAKLGPSLSSRAKAARSDRVSCVVLATMEYEAWFIASVSSLAGKNGLPNNISKPNNPENIRGAKEWLGRQMAGSRTYSPTTDQPALTKLFDMALARRNSPSFDKFWRDVEKLLK